MRVFCISLGVLFFWWNHCLWWGRFSTNGRATILECLLSFPAEFGYYLFVVDFNTLLFFTLTSVPLVLFRCGQRTLHNASYGFKDEVFYLMVPFNKFIFKFEILHLIKNRIHIILCCQWRDFPCREWRMIKNFSGERTPSSWQIQGTFLEMIQISSNSF